MKIYRVWRGEQDMGLYVAHNEREAAAEAANDAGVGLTGGFTAEKWLGLIQDFLPEQPSISCLPSGHCEEPGCLGYEPYDRLPPRAADH